ncbi:FMN-binding protein [Desulfamplus magnetovallimortis]|nr:FMN-binding protein [Desulfamplus magnetovallimortis]
MVEKVQKNNLLQAWLVLTLAFLFGMSLAGVQTVLGPVIEENKIRETMEKVPVVVLGEAEAAKIAHSGASLGIEPSRIAVEKEGRTKFYNVYDAKFNDGKRAGWVAKASAQGYADKIELLVGFDAAVEKITGLFILDQKETPGLGNKIVEDQWRSQFTGKAVATALTVVKTGAKKTNEIDAISGATISSDCVTRMINQTIADLGEELKNRNTENQKGKE